VRAYDVIGIDYRTTRATDPRIAAHIEAALGDAGSVINVGAGTGSYEPPSKQVLAVDPSRVMLRQRSSNAAPAIQAAAEDLPFRNKSFDAAMAVLTVHHWQYPHHGLSELRRIARRRVVVLTWDQEVFESFWLSRSYFPAIAELDRTRNVPLGEIMATLGGGIAHPLPIPHDCRDGFAGAFWRRPAAYLDPAIRSGISSFALMGQEALNEGLRRLANDLESGAWAEHFGHLLTLDDLDLGYRLVVSEQ